MYSQAGNYAVIVGFVVEIVNKIWPGLGFTSEVAMQILGGILAIVGVIHQWRSHKKLATYAGVMPR